MSDTAEYTWNERVRAKRSYQGHIIEMQVSIYLGYVDVQERDGGQKQEVSPLIDMRPCL
jgi:hypothetical protein